jgi:hypothetical protein
MHQEYIQVTRSWRNGPACNNCVLVNTKPNANSTHRFEIAQVFLFFSFLHDGQEYQCAFVQWYSFAGTKCNKDIGCWMVEPDNSNSKSPHIAIIYIDCIVRATHLMPTTRTALFVNRSVTIHTSLNIYDLFYINRFVDNHAFVSLWSREAYHSQSSLRHLSWTWQCNTSKASKVRLYITFLSLLFMS